MNRILLALFGVLAVAIAVQAEGITFNLSKQKIQPHQLDVLNDMMGERLTNKHDVIYKGVVTVGTPAKKFTVVFDTGSGLFWLPAKGCKSSGPHADACKDQTMQYDPTASSTSKRLGGKAFNMYYGTGESKGHLYTDTLRIGDPANGKQLVMENTPVGAAMSIKYIDHGIIGLSLKDNKNPKPVFQQLVDEGKMDKPIFTTYMKKCNGECEDGGALTLGGFDKVNCKEEIHWTPVVTGTSMWRFVVSGVKVGNYEAKNLNKFAITDTGTSYIQMPTQIFNATIRELKAELRAERGSNFYLVPCDAKFSMTFTVSGKDFSVTEKEVLLNQGYGEKCVVAIGDAEKFDMFLLGDAFIRGHCQVYDIKEKKVGFAPVKNH
ncbi:Eukaryotic aspartyl protease [Aphelenchoides bicaudatus]|nr:Eukaryotic aspartyl protease [Aphelenchoides bicaudatus]